MDSDSDSQSVEMVLLVMNGGVVTARFDFKLGINANGPCSIRV